MKKSLIILVAVTLIIIGVGLAYWQLNWQLNKTAMPDQVACTEEAKICPDGSAVGRQGPNCEFAECPITQAVDETAGWKTYRNNEYGFEIKYPENYKIVVDKYGWPNSIVHFIETIPPGAQAYRSTIEVWDNLLNFSNSSNHQGKQPNYSTKIGEKYLTISYQYFLNVDDKAIETEWQKAISSFKLIK